MLNKRCLNLLFLLILPMSINCFATEVVNKYAREGYSFFGAGYDFLDYEENTALKIGLDTIDIETNSALNFTQQSGAYVAVNNDWGFYLVTASTLGDSSSDETWDIGAITVRANKVSFDRQRLGFLASRRFSRIGYFLFGAQYGSTEFNRFAAKLTPQAADFGIDENTFSAGTVSEKVWDLSLAGGYEWNTIFTQKEPGWRYQLQLIAGVTVISHITNTDVNEGSSFSESFNGFQVRLNWAYGYQFNDNMMIAFSLEAGFSRRNAINRDFSDASGIVEFPESNLFYFYPSLVALWSF